MQLKPALFLDRDGVVVEEVEYLSCPSQLALIPRGAEAIARVNRRGIPVVVITNQAGVARGYFPEARIAEVHHHLDKLLSACGARIDRYYYCPHHPTEGLEPYRRQCRCRKPHPGMLHEAALKEGLDLQSSWLVGDKLSDVEAGQVAGCRTVLVQTGHGRTHARLLEKHKHVMARIVPNLWEDVDRFLAALVNADFAGRSPD